MYQPHFSSPPKLALLDCARYNLELYFIRGKVGSKPSKFCATDASYSNVLGCSNLDPRRVLARVGSQHLKHACMHIHKEVINLHMLLEPDASICVQWNNTN